MSLFIFILIILIQTNHTVASSYNIMYNLCNATITIK